MRQLLVAQRRAEVGEQPEVLAQPQDRLLVEQGVEHRVGFGIAGQVGRQFGGGSLAIDGVAGGAGSSGAGMGASGGDNSTSGGTMAAGESGAGTSTTAGGSTSSDPQVAALMAACQGNETSLVMDRMSSM